MRYIEQVQRQLTALGCAVKILDVSILNLSEGGDCADWLQAHPAAPLDELLAIPCLAISTQASQTVKEATEHDPLLDHETIVHLARLSVIEYERVRTEAAKSLELRPPVLDKLVKIAHKKVENNMPFKTVEPWPEPIHPAQLLTDIESSIRRFIACESHIAVAATLWIAMTWFIDVIQAAPLAMITGPEKRCGKSQLLLLFGRLAYRPVPASNITSAALFRTIDAWQPTLLIDEADTFMQQNEELRGLINAGHTRDSSYILRVVGDDHTPKTFCVWSAKAIAGIGKLHETIMDRSIVLEMRRKLPEERVERLRHARPGLFETLAAKLARFRMDYAEHVRKQRPALPEPLNDRAQDNWEALLAIADIAGGEWPVLARNAALFLNCTVEQPQSVGIELLEDMQELFISKSVDRITSYELINGLCIEQEKRWATYNHGSSISPRQIASHLKKFGIRPQAIRTGVRVDKGYIKADFEDVWTRYLNPLVSLQE